MIKALNVKRFGGTVRAQSSKSCMHRALIAAALSEGESTLLHTDLCRDTEATLASLQTLGAHAERVADGTRVTGMKVSQRTVEEPLFCGESASTLRFLIPVLALFGGGRFRCEGRLIDRPIGPIADCFAPFGLSFRREGDCLCLSGKPLSPGSFSIASSVSSQFTSGLLLALPVLSSDSLILPSGKREGKEVSRPYISMTREIQAAFGFHSEETPDGYLVRGGQRGRARTYEIEGDWSNAAFFLTAGAIGRESVTVTHLCEHSLQGDSAVLSLLAAFVARTSLQNGSATVFPSELRGTDIDASDVPDLVPILSVAAAAAEGKSRFFGVSRLRAKESDRLRAVIDMLASLGVHAESDGEILTVEGRGRLTGGCVDAYGDHRLAMSAAVAAVRARKKVDIIGAESVSKSYPAFFEDYESLATLAEN